MKVWRCIIVDDESLAREELAGQLAGFPQVELVGEAADLGQAVDLVRRLGPDLVFLDIDLGVHSGFELLERVDTGFKVIFVTAHDEFAIRAFEVNALDYLLKPVWPDRLGNCLKRLGDPYSGKLPENLDSSDQILVRMRNSSRFIRVNEITCIEACGDYTRIYSARKASGLVHHTLKRWLDRLPGGSFVRVHKSYIVNTAFVLSIDHDREEGTIVRLPWPEKPVQVSRRFGSRLFSGFKP